MIAVEGIITKCSPQRPKLVKSIHYCPSTQKYSSKDYRDALSLDLDIEINGMARNPTPSVYPTHDAEENPLETEYGLSEFKDYQTITIQEMPERSTVGQLPRSVQVVLEHDLVDKVKPGDRVRVSGVFRSLGNKSSQGGNSTTSGIFKTLMMATSVSKLGRDVGALNFVGSDISNIRELSAKNDILSILARSLCPSIFGHDFIKKALILQLLGGVEKDLENGAHLRGDINILMVGDPSTAKSQLLRAILEVAPLAVSTSGRGSSGVGLTAAVTSDPETRERRLEAGAMVLADRGVVCIDEFDKMTEVDRVAIHEAMEQQTVTIAKAGLHASLNARCSVLAAANPIYGMYDRSKRPQENIGLPDSLLSRFDLVFVVLDQMDPTSDRQIANHVLSSHMYRKPGSDMTPEEPPSSFLFADDEEDDGEGKATRVWQRSSTNPTSSLLSTRSRSSRRKLKRGKKRGEEEEEEEEEETKANEVLTKPFLKKYIHYAKQRSNPILTEEANELIAQSFSEMRIKSEGRNLPVTARSLETIIRLSTAHAKARLSKEVEEDDVEIVVELMNYVLYHEVGTFASSSTPSLLSKRKTREGEEEEDEDSWVKSKKRNNGESENEEEEEEEEEEEISTPVIKESHQDSDALIRRDGSVNKRHPTYSQVLTLISKMESGFHIDSLTSQVAGVTDDQMLGVVKGLQEDNRIWFSEEDGMIDII